MDIAAFVSAFGAGLLLVYALGLRIPFLVIALAANLLLARLSKIHKFSRKTAATLVAAVALWALAMFAFAGCGQSSDSNSGSSASNSGGSQPAGSDKQGDTVGTVTTDIDIPTREMFGARMNADDITGNPHSWAEFYLNGTGWVSADPADVLKAVLKGGWTKDQQETKDKAEYYWGGLDSQRVQLSAGRDITLSPAQNDEALNYFGYPYGEVDGSALDFYDPENFSCRISFTAE